MARLFGYAALLPYASTGLLVWVMSPSQTAEAALYVQLTYSAIALSFVGGIRAGFTFAKAGNFKRRAPDGFNRNLILAGIIPALAWATLFIRPNAALLVFALIFAAQFASDVRAHREEIIPDWYVALSGRLTLLTEIALIATLIKVQLG
jgi:hypothetical protein